MFPWETLAVGALGASLLAALRHWLNRGALEGAGGISPQLDTKRPTRWHIRDISVVLVLVFIALALRLWNLEARVVDNDEPASFGWIDLEGWAKEHDARLHPPLSPWLMSAAFGLRAILADARSVSVIAGLVVVALVFAALRERGRTTAGLAALFVAWAPAMLHASQMARGYALAAALVLATHVLLTRALVQRSERAWLLYTLLGTLSLFTEYVTLVPICAEALVVVFAGSSSRSARLGVITSLGGMLAISACFVPLAFSTFSLGVGGPPRAPDGVWPPLKHGLELFGGAGGAALGGLALLLALSAWWPLAKDNSGHAAPPHAALVAARRASAAALFGFALLALGGLITAMRARYVLPVFPLLIVACAAAASPIAAPSTRSTLLRRLGALTIITGAALFVSHAALLPCYLGQTCATSEIGRGPPLRNTLAVLRANTRAAVVVVPSWSIAEPSYRLIHKFPDRDSRRDCPARLCVGTAQRAMYGLDVDEFAKRFPKLRDTLGLAYVLVRGPKPPGLDVCSVRARDADAVLYRCER